MKICLAPTFFPSCLLPLEPHPSYSSPLQSPTLLAFFSPDGSFPLPSVHPLFPSSSISTSIPFWASLFAGCFPPVTTSHTPLPSSYLLVLCFKAKGSELAISLQKTPKHLKFTALEVLLVKLLTSSMYLHIHGYLSCLWGSIRLSGCVRQNTAEGRYQSLLRKVKRCLANSRCLTNSNTLFFFFFLG